MNDYYFFTDWDQNVYNSSGYPNCIYDPVSIDDFSDYNDDFVLSYARIENEIQNLTQLQSGTSPPEITQIKRAVVPERIRRSSCFSICPLEGAKQLNEYLNKMVLDGQLKKLSKDYKIVIFKHITNYVQSNCPHLYNNDFRTLSRDDKRSVYLLDNRLLAIKDIIYQILESEENMNIKIQINKEICEMIQKHKKKNVKVSLENLSFINKFEIIQNK